MNERLSPLISAEGKVIINSHYYIQTCIILSSVWNGFERICLLKLKMENDSFRRDLTLFRLACYKQSCRKWVTYVIHTCLHFVFAFFALASSCTWQCSRTCLFITRDNLKIITNNDLSNANGNSTYFLFHKINLSALSCGAASAFFQTFCMHPLCGCIQQ